MKKILFAICIVFASCYKSNDEKITQMKSPVIVVSVGGNWFSGFQATMKDGNGKIITLYQYSFESLKKGDTIK